ncbi:HAD-IIA family hydrolase [Mesoaciditoga lauensis]|uniref:HAD-IIA family hydrolase n=1 Tax=Mesoaciditoga lauensis TaxID=1495039 RepID=UPI0005620262|nr:HAD-IIA family hydrolase [Mesoaciditoga lauensis]
MNSDLIEMLKKAKLFAFDLDGTTIIDSKPLEGIKDLLNYLLESGKSVCFLTNNSSRTNVMHAERLSKIFNMNITENDMMSSLDSLELFLERKSIKRIYPFLNERVKKYLKEKFIFDDENPDVIAVGFNTDAVYSQLEKVSQLIFEGVPYLLVHPDLRCPTSFGYIPDAGSFGKLFELTTDKKPIWVGGKPNPIMVEGLAKKYNVDENEIVYVGDRLYTDIEMVKNSGIYGVLVLTGETTLEEFKNYKKSTGIKRVAVAQNAKELLKMVKE